MLNWVIPYLQLVLETEASFQVANIYKRNYVFICDKYMCVYVCVRAYACVCVCVRVRVRVRVHVSTCV